MHMLHKEFETNEDLFDMEMVIHELTKGESATREILIMALKQRLSLHCFSAAYNYWVDMTTVSLPANLIQAQRDFFGAHTYQRVDAPGSDFYHTEW